MENQYFFFLFNNRLYDAHVAKSFHLDLIVERQRDKFDKNPPTSEASVPTVFSRETWRIAIATKKGIRIAKHAVTSESLLDSILNPQTALGVMILLSILNPDEIIDLRKESAQRRRLKQVFTSQVDYFPAYLLNSRFIHPEINIKDRRCWCEISDKLVVAAPPSHQPSRKTLHRFVDKYRAPSTANKIKDKWKNLRPFKSR